MFILSLSDTPSTMSGLWMGNARACKGNASRRIFTAPPYSPITFFCSPARMSSPAPTVVNVPVRLMPGLIPPHPTSIWQTHALYSRTASAPQSAAATSSTDIDSTSFSCAGSALAISARSTAISTCTAGCRLTRQFTPISMLRAFRVIAAP